MINPYHISNNIKERTNKIWHEAHDKWTEYINDYIYVPQHYISQCNYVRGINKKARNFYLIKNTLTSVLFVRNNLSSHYLDELINYCKNNFHNSSNIYSILSKFNFTKKLLDCNEYIGDISSCEVIKSKHFSSHPHLLETKTKTIGNFTQKGTTLSYSKFCSNPNITEKFIEDNIDKNLCWSKICSQPNISFEFIKKHNKLGNVIIKQQSTYNTNRNNKNNENYKYITWKDLSLNPNITIKHILNNVNKPWDWKHITTHKNIKINEILKYIYLPWELTYIQLNPNFTLEHIKILQNKNIKVDWSLISLNQNITINDIENNLNGNWSWQHLLSNKNITTSFIQKYNEKFEPYLVKNKNNNKYLLEFKYLNSTTFQTEREHFIENYYRKHLAALFIQNAWKNARINPYTKLGQLKIEQYMDEIGLEHET